MTIGSVAYNKPLVKGSFMFRLKSTFIVAISLLFLAFAGGVALQAENSKPAAQKLERAYTAEHDNAERKLGHDVGYFAGGCFWGTEYEFKSLPGVIHTSVGYTGGKTDFPTYQQVCGHGTGHAEAVRVVFDPKKISYEKLVQEFMAIHDPTTLNRQGPDVGDQYRSAIFFENDKQKEIAQQVMAAEAKTMPAGRHIVTTLEKFGTFYTAEDYHQDYFAKTGQASCHIRRK
jgi:methionine-S-sulfoxide reductase